MVFCFSAEKYIINTGSNKKIGREENSSTANHMIEFDVDTLKGCNRYYVPFQHMHGSYINNKTWRNYPFYIAHGSIDVRGRVNVLMSL